MSAVCISDTNIDHRDTINCMCKANHIAIFKMLALCQVALLFVYSCCFAVSSYPLGDTTVEMSISSTHA